MSKEERIQKWQAEKEWLTKYLSRFPQCAGYPDCDGELGHGEPHDPACPCFGKTGLRRPSIPEILATFAAETKLSEPQAVPEMPTLPKHIVDAIKDYFDTDWKSCDPTHFGALNSAAYIGEQVAGWWKRESLAAHSPAPDTKGLLDALQKMVDDGCPERGEHDINCCVYCYREGHNRRFGDHYSVKHAPECPLALAESALTSYRERK